MVSTAVSGGMPPICSDTAIDTGVVAAFGAIVSSRARLPPVARTTSTADRTDDQRPRR